MLRTLTLSALAAFAAAADEPVGTVIGIDLGTTYSVRPPTRAAPPPAFLGAHAPSFERARLARAPHGAAQGRGGPRGAEGAIRCKEHSRRDGSVRSFPPEARHRSRREEGGGVV